MRNKEQLFWGILRVSMGWIFLWAFLDKVFGFGFATEPGKAWIDGASPTIGFLKFGTKGPFSELYQSIAGNMMVDWLFMLGLLFVGVALMLGIMVKLAGYTGALMLILMYTAGSIFPENNPLLDDHIIYAIVLIGLTFGQTGHWLGIGGKWSQIGFVRKYQILE